MTELRVKHYYNSAVRKEWRRLVKDAYHRLEFDTTLRFLEAYLPPRGLILDTGGGPGRYTIELAKRGYRVVLLDLSPANLTFARREIGRAKVQDNVASICEGSIADLGQFPDGSFDAVMCLGGPLSHLSEKQARDRAISELIRVTKSGAPLFVAVIGRLGFLVAGLTLFQDEIGRPHFERISDEGDYAGDYEFTACHLFLPEELRDAFVDQGVHIQQMVGLEGLGTHHRRDVNRLARDKRRWNRWLEIHHRTCTHPSVVGLSEHILMICRKI